MECTETDGGRWVEAWGNSLQIASIFSMKLEAKPPAEQEERREEKVKIAIRRMGESQNCCIMMVNTKGV